MTTVVEFYVPEKNRKNSVQQLSKHFDKKHCAAIEQGFYNYTEQFCKSHKNNLIMAQAIYKDIVKNLIFNCEQDHPTIKKIKKKISKGKYNPYNLAFLEPDELDEDNWMRIILRKNTTEEKLNNLPTIEWKPCYDCKSIEYFYCQLQTRSADEPMTTFYVCKKCNKTYKVNN
jgi:DNA-directed RNA polymerase subunit M/transcription elongation factor TFIIS